MNKPNKVKNCTTHHYACECREWRYNKMQEALEKITELSLRSPLTIATIQTGQLLEVCKEGLES